MSDTRAVRVILYLRLSDLRNDDLDGRGAGKTFSAREEELRDFVEDMGGTVVDVVIENDVSSKDGKHRNASAFKKRTVTLKDGTKVLRVVRPGFDLVIEALTSGAATMLVCEDSDRITRDQFDGGRLIDLVEQRKLNVRTLTGAFNLTNGGTDVEIGHAWDCVNKANQESRKIANRVRRGRKRKARRGEFGGGPRPFGFEADGIGIRPAEAAVVRECSERVLKLDRHSGKPTSLRLLAAQLRNRTGANFVPTASGTQWSAECLREILLRPRNAGLMVYQGEEIGEAPWPAIVPVDVFRAVVALLRDELRRTTDPGGAPPRWLGSGIYLCGVCDDGTTMEVSSGTGRQPRYRCKKFAHLVRSARHLDAAVREAIVARLERDDAVGLIVQQPTPGVDVGALRAERAEIRRNLNDLVADRVLNRISKEQLHTGTEVANKRIGEIDELIKVNTVRSPLTEIVGAEDVRAAWDSQDFAIRRAALAGVMCVTVLPVPDVEPEAVLPFAPLPKGVRVTGEQRQQLVAAVAEDHARRVSLRSMAAALGRSFGFVHDLAREAGIPPEEPTGRPFDLRTVSIVERQQATQAA